MMERGVVEFCEAAEIDDGVGVMLDVEMKLSLEVNGVVISF
jgi:hypothetical protein